MNNFACHQNVSLSVDAGIWGWVCKPSYFCDFQGHRASIDRTVLTLGPSLLVQETWGGQISSSSSQRVQLPHPEQVNFSLGKVSRCFSYGESTIALRSARSLLLSSREDKDTSLFRTSECTVACREVAPKADLHSDVRLGIIRLQRYSQLLPTAGEGASLAQVTCTATPPVTAWEEGGN